MNQYNFILVHKNKDFNKYNKLVKDSLPQNWIKANMTINIHNVDDNNKALQFIETYFSEIKEKNHQNTYFSPLIVLQSSFSLQNLKELGYKQLVQNFPCIQMNNWMKIQENTYTILDWQKKGIKYICQRSEKIQEELDYAIQLCSQVQIPLCNLDFSKPISYLTDVIFARLLKQSNCISWYGIYSNNQNNNGQTQKDFQHLIPSDFLKNEVVFPGLYVNHTVEINIELLALNTIANADELKNIDKETSILFEMKKKIMINMKERIQMNLLRLNKHLKFCKLWSKVGQMMCNFTKIIFLISLFKIYMHGFPRKTRLCMIQYYRGCQINQLRKFFSILYRNQEIQVLKQFTRLQIRLFQILGKIHIGKVIIMHNIYYKQYQLNHFLKYQLQLL
ncbi:hypothetical protein IMG5_030330 [Ichthyophthirius multifiliis]|uniref:DNA polymerase epsilon catalytic subunit n=1 Tax=Ichthyophthirius multifiliis TaxID=5932 RepID=G0QLH0_ICHMU|nr:hypothetical protein IMG5_030330 [Ichthyophthirius multifiliis]EGR33935.1 hypothetical protein IMG5_030330 [Ichthyophthirius multifiliis]|eukprot:XP_004039239.1 hypothetical protein IMG5_030330 [Ichthyophthirius multifiliis]